MNPMDDAHFGMMMGLAGAAGDAMAAYRDWERYAHEVQGNRDLWMAHAKKLEAAIRDLADKLAVEQAHSEGLKGVIDMFKELHPDSPLMEEVGVFTSKRVAGIKKRRYHLIYEAAFDHEARQNGIENPKDRRHS